MGKAKLPSIASNSLSTSHASYNSYQRTTVSSPGVSRVSAAKLPAIGARHRSNSDSALPSQPAKPRRHSRKTVQSVDRNDSDKPSRRPSPQPKRRVQDQNKAPEPEPAKAKNVRRISGGSRKRGKKNGRKEETPEKDSEKRDSKNEGLVRKSKFVIPIGGKSELLKRYKFSSVIGDGNFAVVSRCLDRRDGSAWAVKEIDKANVKGKVYYIENEVDLMLRCSHAAICRLREAYQSPDAYFLVLELVEGGDVSTPSSGRAPSPSLAPPPSPPTSPTPSSTCTPTASSTGTSSWRTFC